jgi:hypothetical protein
MCSATKAAKRSSDMAPRRNDHIVGTEVAVDERGRQSRRAAAAVRPSSRVGWADRGQQDSQVIPSVHAELPVDRAEMVVDRATRQVQPFGDLTGAEILSS